MNEFGCKLLQLYIDLGLFNVYNSKFRGGRLFMCVQQFNDVRVCIFVIFEVFCSCFYVGCCSFIRYGYFRNEIFWIFSFQLIFFRILAVVRSNLIVCRCEECWESTEWGCYFWYSGLSSVGRIVILNKIQALKVRKRRLCGVGS